MRVLVMGLPGSGKSFLVNQLKSLYQFDHFNADVIRKKYNDWDFSIEGRIRQAYRMRTLADSSTSDIVICDFVCPLMEMREIFDPHFLIFVDTVVSSKYENTNNLFQKPKNCDIIVTDWEYNISNIWQQIQSKYQSIKLLVGE